MPTPSQTPIHNKKDIPPMPKFQPITPKFNMNNQERYYPSPSVANGKEDFSATNYHNNNNDNNINYNNNSNNNSMGGGMNNSSNYSNNNNNMMYYNNNNNNNNNNSNNNNNHNNNHISFNNNNNNNNNNNMNMNNNNNNNNIPMNTMNYNNNANNNNNNITSSSNQMITPNASPKALNMNDHDNSPLSVLASLVINSSENMNMNTSSASTSSMPTNTSMAYSSQHIASQVKTEPNTHSYEEHKSEGSLPNGTDANSAEIPAFGIKMKKIYNLCNSQSFKNIDIINNLRKPIKYRRRPLKDIMKYKENENVSSASSTTSSSFNDNEIPDSHSISNFLLSMKEGHQSRPMIGEQKEMEEGQLATGNMNIQYQKKRPGRKPKKRILEEDIRDDVMNYTMETNNAPLPSSSNYYQGQGQSQDQSQSQGQGQNQNQGQGQVQGQGLDQDQGQDQGQGQSQVPGDELGMNEDDPNNMINGQVRKKRKYTRRTEEGVVSADAKAKGVKSTRGRKPSKLNQDPVNGEKDNYGGDGSGSSSSKATTPLINETKKILSNRSIEELKLSEKVDLLPSSLINLLKNGKYAIVKYHGSTECIGIQKCDTMLGKKELKKIKELQFNSNELETSKALRIKFENDSKKSQHRFLIITPVVWKHWNWFNLQNAEIDYTKQQ